MRMVKWVVGLISYHYRDSNEVGGQLGACSLLLNTHKTVVVSRSASATLYSIIRFINTAHLPKEVDSSAS